MAEGKGKPGWAVWHKVDGGIAVVEGVIAALSAGDPTAIEEKDLVRGLSSMTHFATLSPPRRVYDELSNAGAASSDELCAPHRGLRRLNLPRARCVERDGANVEHTGRIGRGSRLGRRRAGGRHSGMRVRSPGVRPGGLGRSHPGRRTLGRAFAVWHWAFALAASDQQQTQPKN